MIILRPATTADVPWLLRELEEFSKFFGSKHSLFPGQEYGAAKLVELISTHVVIIACASIQEEPIGFVAGMLAPHFFNPAIIVLTELFWWVTPEWRRGRAGLLLLEEFIRFGKEQADWVLMTLEEKSPVNSVSLERRGFKLWERSYLLEVD